MVFLLFLVFSSSSASPHIDCFLDNQECEITSDNLVHTFMGISAIDECRELCEAEVMCAAFTHYGTDSSPIHDACLLFSSCSETRPWPTVPQDQVSVSRSFAVHAAFNTLGTSTQTILLISLEAFRTSSPARGSASQTMTASCTPTMTARTTSSLTAASC